MTAAGEAIGALVRQTMHRFEGKPYSEAEVRAALVEALIGKSYPMKSEPHILDLKMVR